MALATPPVLRVVERQARVFRHLWRGSIFFGFLSPILFLAAMGVGLGGLIDERTGDVDGLDYLTFVTPGLMAASAMQSAANDSLWPVMAGNKWVRFFHGIVATPVRARDVYAGVVLWAGLRTALMASAFLIVASLLGGVPSPWAVLAVPAAMLTALAFSAPLAAYAATQTTDVSFAVIMRLGVLPLFLFSGTFFPIDQLPEGLQPLAVASPLWHGVELARSATTGSIGLLPSTGHVAALLVVIALGWQWGNRTFTRRLSQ
jgi:lipooligosaccharide transport system permease protein